MNVSRKRFTAHLEVLIFFLDGIALQLKSVRGLKSKFNDTDIRGVMLFSIGEPV